MNEDVFKHYRIGIPSMDQEHFQIVELIDKIKHCSKDDTVDDLLAVAKLLCETIAKHMEGEEKFMENINFPFVSFHKQTHQEMLLSLRNKVRHLHTHQGFVFFSDFVERLMMNHFDTMDSQYVPFATSAKKV